MSVTLAKVRSRVRARLQDMDGRHASPDGVAIDMALAETWIRCGSRLPAPLLYTASAFTISAGADTFSLPVTVTGSGYGTGTTEYGGETRIRMAANGRFLFKISHAQMDGRKNWIIVTPLGIPLEYALYQDSGQVVRGRCWPGANADYACDLWATIRVEDLRDYVGAAGNEGMDTVSIPGTREAVLALEALTAGELLSRMTADTAAARGLERSKAADWTAEGMDLLYGEEQRQHSIRSTGRIQRFVP